MSDSKIILKDDDFYIGERIYVELRLFDELNDGPASGLAVLLTFTNPNKVETTVSMEEVVGDPGLYRGSSVVDVEGNWRIRAVAGNESVFRHDRLYVSA